MKTLIDDLKTLYEKRMDFVANFKDEPFSIKINGDTYETEDEILNGYGCCMMTRKQCENALNKLRYHTKTKRKDYDRIKSEIRLLLDIMNAVENNGK